MEDFIPRGTLLAPQPHPTEPCHLLGSLTPPLPHSLILVARIEAANHLIRRRCCVVALKPPA